MKIIFFAFTLFFVNNSFLQNYNSKYKILNKNKNKFIKRNILSNNNIVIRKLSDDENTKKDDDENKKEINENKNTTKIKENIGNNNDNDKDNQKNGLGAFGVVIVIILSVAILYIAYSGFRHYRRKKYQNPSFYYKITEEMFDDITPIE